MNPTRTIKNLSYVVIIYLALFTKAQAQTHYKVYFTEKNTEFVPEQYFDAKALERRAVANIAIDQTDYPVNPSYISQVSAIATETGYASRWFNLLFIEATETQITEIEQFPFVRKVEHMELTTFCAEHKSDFDTLVPSTKEWVLEQQTNMLHAKRFRKEGLTGKGVRIAVFDAGFPGVDTNPIFEHLRANNRIIQTRDFVRNKSNVYKANKHGRMVLACIAGKLGDTYFGLAPDAEMLLAITESYGEPLSEEENWLAAVEWADKLGADIINSSLGYTYKRYFPYQMNGKVSLIARAANLATRKGILVVNAMGNDGDSQWKYLGTPADADSVLAVGAISPYTGYRSSFSSYGPTSDNRLKPNVSAPGEVVVPGKKRFDKVFGTSFASPLVAGFAACVKQAQPELMGYQLKTAIEQSGALYPYFDYAHGYGTPSAYKYFNTKYKRDKISFDVSDMECTVVIPESVIVEGGINRLYYHIENHEGHLHKYALMDVTEVKPLTISLDSLKNHAYLRVHYNGQNLELKLDDLFGK